MASASALLIASLVASTAVAGASLLRKQPKPIKATPRPTINEARRRADERDLLARRQGTNETKRVGFGAGEAFTGPKTSLLGRA